MTYDLAQSPSPEAPDYEELRFRFGANWERFLRLLNEQRIAQAEESLRVMLGCASLKGRTFLDIGSGSGLFSLAAKRLGAERVHSFDYDRDSVACTSELRRRFFRNDQTWTIEQASVLDGDYMRGLGQFDVAYSWGVLHHTGNMWAALELSAERVAPGGHFYIAIYNDQGGASRRWGKVKRLYNRLPRPLAFSLVVTVGAYFELRNAVGRAMKFQNPLPVAQFKKAEWDRGMNRWHDLVDWVGGYPFEVAKPEEIFSFAQERGFRLNRLITCGGGLGCNQFVFVRE